MRSIIAVLSLAALVTACGATPKTKDATSTSDTAAAAPTATSADQESAPVVEEPATTASPEPSTPASSGGSPEDAKQRLAEFTKAGVDTAKLTQTLKPSASDLAAIFDASVLPAMQEHVDKMFASMGKGLELIEAPEVRCFSSDEIKSWTADVQRDMPGGYKRLGPKLKSGLTFCRFKAGGISYDSLVSVGGKWMFVPKPFRAVR